MGGWFVDVIVGYFVTLYRILARNLRVRESREWTESMATVAGASCQCSLYMPRPVAEIVYTYHSNGGFYGGVDEKPFFLRSSAEDYAGQFTRGDKLVVRVKPGEPQISILRDEDQSKVKQSASSARDSRLT